MSKFLDRSIEIFNHKVALSQPYSIPGGGGAKCILMASLPPNRLTDTPVNSLSFPVCLLQSQQLKISALISNKNFKWSVF